MTPGDDPVIPKAEKPPVADEGKRARPRSKTWAMDMIRRYMPTREQMAANKYLAPIAHRFLSPELWRFTRRSVPRGVALGLFSAFIIPVGQIFLAAFLALPSRANVPLATLATFVTNPLTIPFWLVAANRVGTFTLQLDASTTGLAAESMETEAWSWFVEFFQQAGATVFGFAVMAVVSASIGYLASGWIWRVIIGRRRAKRLKVMEDRLDQRLGSQ
jgi:uncharacterized protein